MRELFRIIRTIPIKIVALIMLSQAVSELWHLFPITGEWSPFLYSDLSTTPAIIVKDFCKEIERIIDAIIIYQLAVYLKDKFYGLRITAFAYLSYRILDIFAWWIDHKEWSNYKYVWVAVVLVEFMLYIYYIKKSKKNI